MANVLGNTTDDLEITALGASKGEEALCYRQLCRREEIKNHTFVRRAVDGARYDQYYPEISEENLRFLLKIVKDNNLLEKDCSKNLLLELEDIMANGSSAQREQIISSIEQIRLFDARDKDISTDNVPFHPLKLDIKFRALETDALRRKIITWRSNENGDSAMISALNQFTAQAGDKMGHINRYFVGLEWIVPEFCGGIRERILEILAQECSERESLFDNHAVKLDVRYDDVLTISGEKIQLVTREVELNNNSNQFPSLLKGFKNDGYIPFLSAEMGFGKLIRSAHPQELISDVIKKRAWPWRISMIMDEMAEQVNTVIKKFQGGQIVVKLDRKAEVLKGLTTRCQKDL